MARVLVVEDMPDVRAIHVLLLELLGYVTVSASDGEEGLTLLTEEVFDVVLTDDRMPRMNGPEMLMQAAPVLAGRTARIFECNGNPRQPDELDRFADLQVSLPLNFRDLGCCMAEAVAIRESHLINALHASPAARRYRVHPHRQPASRSLDAGPLRESERPATERILEAAALSPSGEAAGLELQQLLQGEIAPSHTPLPEPASVDVRAMVQRNLETYWEAEGGGLPLRVHWVGSPFEACSLLARALPGPTLCSRARSRVWAARPRPILPDLNEQPLESAAARALVAELYARNQAVSAVLRPGHELAALHGLDLQHLGVSTLEAIEKQDGEQSPVASLLRALRPLVGWFWLYDDGFAVVTERHGPPRGHDDGRLHAEDGPAVMYPDGFGAWALEGFPVRRHQVEAPDTMSAQAIRRTPNAELRRLLRERFGTDRYIREIGATVVACDTVPVDGLAPGGGSLTRALIETADGDRCLVSSDGSTNRVYYMRVPSTCATCQQAYDALSGRPGVRTIVEA